MKKIILLFIYLAVVINALPPRFLKQPAGLFSLDGKTQRVNINNFISSSYSYQNSTSQQFNSLYMAQLVFNINSKLAVDCWIGFDLANYNPVEGFSTGLKPSTDNLKGFSLLYDNHKDFSFKIKYGEDFYDTRRAAGLLPLLNSAPDYTLYHDRLDALSMQLRKSFFNGKINLLLQVQTPELGLR
ncbi:MAG TPA: hypothetical protein VKS21_11435 [Spirochaetota bacterium]|nr:hypothetical protein [Spirochaetota bacterium]